MLSCFTANTTEVATGGCSAKKMLLKTLLKRDSNTCVFFVKLVKFLKTSIFKNFCKRLLLQDITEKIVHLFLSQN